jgi:hypothetical protein
LAASFGVVRATPEAKLLGQCRALLVAQFADFGRADAVPNLDGSSSARPDDRAAGRQAGGGAGGAPSLGADARGHKLRLNGLQGGRGVGWIDPWYWQARPCGPCQAGYLLLLATNGSASALRRSRDHFWLLVWSKQCWIGVRTQQNGGLPGCTAFS